MDNQIDLKKEICIEVSHVLSLLSEIYDEDFIETVTNAICNNDAMQIDAMIFELMCTDNEEEE